ncbi:GNAT family N-acetyltransferase [Pararhizobium sp. IMCC21322]|uniref:GNAT family N-acetyltransferase n=1 Tax=Pararhizobium sp. IMCC21322 TaxID=3067903 RepID=UPI002742294A|nr:GNAT family N-acetyltransferase [Pararhizobium sp. IMCC21322]
MASFLAAKPADAEALADIRTEAMQPSLEAIGRFHPVRVRERFLSSFILEDTQLILHDSEMVGFFVVRTRKDHLLLDHLYLKASALRLGLGQRVVRHVQNIAGKANIPIKLMALKNSAANEFYKSLGFTRVAEEGFDNCYEWHPSES